MAVIYTPFTIRAVLNYTSLSVPCANVLHVRKEVEEAVTIDDVTDAATTVLNWWIAKLKVAAHVGVTLLNCTATDISSPSGLQFIAVPGTTQVGSAGGAAMPNNVSFAIKFGTGLAGRSYRGRYYHIGFSEAMVTDNSIITANANQIRDAFGDLATALDAVGLEHVVVSKQLNGAPRTVGVATKITTYSYTDLKVDTQRKRLS